MGTPMAGDSHVNNMSSLLTSLCERTEGDTVSIADLLNAVGRRSYGPVLLLLGFTMPSMLRPDSLP